MPQHLPGSDHTFTITQEYLGMALSQVSLGFWEVNLTDNNFMSCTDQCKRNFGWDVSKRFSYEDMMGCILPEDLPGMQERVRTAIHDRQPYFAQYRVRHPDGNIRWIEAQGKVIFEENIPQKIIGTTVDITEKKDLETLRDEMLSVAMHELKTPLSAVKGSLQLLERHLQQQGDAQAVRIASRALGSTDRITRLLNEMYEPVLIRSKEIVLAKTDFDLRRLTEEVAENAGMLHTAYRIAIYAPAPEVMVYADRYRIGQVLTNLINNAIKYSPGETNVEVHIQVSAAGTSVQVHDHGLGIPPEDRHRVFQKFYRSNPPESIEGLGIGLFLCAEIILRHGGRIAVEDIPGPGTTIGFLLPS